MPTFEEHLAPFVQAHGLLEAVNNSSFSMADLVALSSVYPEFEPREFIGFMVVMDIATLAERNG